MKRREYRIGPGAASLLLVVVVVSMSVLGLLALINARGDHKLTERGVQFAVSEYTASAQAEHRLAELDGVLAMCARQAGSEEEYRRLVSENLPAGMEMEADVVSWEQDSQHGRTLMCAVKIEPLEAGARYTWREHAFAAVEGEAFYE